MSARERRSYPSVSLPRRRRPRNFVHDCMRRELRQTRTYVTDEMVQMVLADRSYYPCDGCSYCIPQTENQSVAEEK